MLEILQTTAEIAAAFAGFASVVVIFRRRGNIHTDDDTRVTFQSMLLGSLFVVFFSLLPMVLSGLLGSHEAGFFCSAALLLLYILGAFVWGFSKGGTGSAVPYFVAAFIIACTQSIALLGFFSLEDLYVVGVFTLLTISGYAFYSLISFGEANQSDA